MLSRSGHPELVSYQLTWLIMDVKHIMQRTGEGGECNQVQPFHMVEARFMT